MKKFTVGDLTYLAGLIDGDGSIIAQNVRRHDYANKFQIRLTVQVTQRNKRREHLEQIKSLIGAGRIQVNKKAIANYQLTEASEVYNFLEQLLPYLRMKKKQAALVIRIIQQLPAAKVSKEEFLKLAELADQVASYNDSKKRTVTAAVVANELADHVWKPS